jgi:tetratricopeptide (TPR) repeat protein
VSHQISLWTGLIGIGATIALVQPIAVAKSSVEIAETAKAITVLITEPNSVGSGVILQQQGDIYTVLTAAHVVRSKANYKITTPDDRAYEVISSSIRSAPGSIDLAVVKFKSTTKYPIAKLGNCNILKSGMDLYVSGFPATSRAINELIFVFREGKVSANSNKVLENGYSLVYSNSTLPGMSGGAVLNSDGELVAIHGKGDRDGNDAKTGFNLGIPINRLATVASNMGVNLGGQVAPIPQNTAPKADDYVASAGQKYRKGDYRGSLADLNRAIQFNPNLAIAYNHRGFLKADKLQDLQGALVDYNRAIQLNPNFAVTYYNRGLLKKNKLQDLQGALVDYNRAIQLDPKDTDAYNNRGLLKAEKLQDLQGGLADFNRAIQLDPKLAVAYSNRGTLKADKLQDLQGGLADFNRAIQLNPNLALAYNNRGLLKANKLQDSQDALADYNRAIQLDPKLALAYNNRGFLKVAKLQDLQGGLADYNRAIQLDPNFALAYANRGRLKSKYLKDRSGAIADIQQVVRLFQQQGNTELYQKGSAYLKEIEGNHSQPIATNTNNAEGYYSQGDKKADAGSYREAIVDFSRSIALNSRYAQAYVGRGRSKYELKDYRGAISDYKQALSIDPQYASAYYNIALVKAKQNDLKGAISDMQQAVKLYQQQGKQQDAQDATAQMKQWQQTRDNTGF